MVLERNALETFLSGEAINEMIEKIRNAPDGTVIFNTKCYRNQDVEETILSLADVKYTIALIGTECIYIKGV